MMTDEQDRMYMQIAQAARIMSTCRKKKLGCVVVMPLRGYAWVQGTNGPPFPLNQCEPGCPRISTPSGRDLGLCMAVHAERQALLNAARYGLCTERAILYSDMGVPCKDCMLEIISAGVAEIVCKEETYYDASSEHILNEWVSKGGKFRVLGETGV